MRLLHLPSSHRMLSLCSATAMGSSAAAKENGRKSAWIPARARDQNYRSPVLVVEVVSARARRNTSCKTWCGTQQETRTCVSLSVQLPPPFCVICDAAFHLPFASTDPEVTCVRPAYAHPRRATVLSPSRRRGSEAREVGFWFLRIRMRRNRDLADELAH